MAGRDIRIEEVENGFVIRAWSMDDSGGGLYGNQKEIVSTSKDQVVDFLRQWLDKKAPPFKTDAN